MLTRSRRGPPEQLFIPLERNSLQANLLPRRRAEAEAVAAARGDSQPSASACPVRKEEEEEPQPGCARPSLRRRKPPPAFLPSRRCRLRPLCLAALMAPASRISDLRQAGNEQFRSGQYSQAAALYGKALELLEATGDVDPEERSVLYSNRAACYLKDGNCSLCIKDCSVALDLVPFGIKPLLRRAAAYEALERYQLAYVDYKTTLQVDCTVQAAHDGVNRMTKALLEKDGLQWRQKLPPIPTVPVSAQRRWDSPVGSQEDTLRSKSNTAPVTKPRTAATTTEKANALKQEGNEFVKKGNYKKAIEKYTESLQLHKLECATYTNRALCYLNLKQYKEAIQDCSAALKIDSKNVKAFYRRAQAYKELKDYKSSVADINRLLKIEPANTAAQKLLEEMNKLLK